jgi:hypothetical protein
MDKTRKLTAAESKRVAIPRTVQEKFDRMKAKNAELEKLRDAFDLDISL